MGTGTFLEVKWPGLWPPTPI